MSSKPSRETLKSNFSEDSEVFAFFESDIFPNHRDYVVFCGIVVRSLFQYLKEITEFMDVIKAASGDPDEFFRNRQVLEATIRTLYLTNNLTLNEEQERVLKILQG